MLYFFSSENTQTHHNVKLNKACITWTLLNVCIYINMHKYIYLCMHNEHKKTLFTAINPLEILFKQIPYNKRSFCETVMHMLLCDSTYNRKLDNFSSSGRQRKSLLTSPHTLVHDLLLF